MALLAFVTAPPERSAPPPDMARLRAYAEYQDIPFALALACWNAERGVPGYQFGQRRLSWEIPVLFPGEEQMAQAARTLRNAKRAFIKQHPDWYSEFQGSDTAFLDRYITKFSEHLAYHGWKPKGNPPLWARNVVMAYEDIKKRDSWERPPSIKVK